MRCTFLPPTVRNFRIVQLFPNRQTAPAFNPTNRARFFLTGNSKECDLALKLYFISAISLLSIFFTSSLLIEYFALKCFTAPNKRDSERHK